MVAAAFEGNPLMRDGAYGAISAPLIGAAAGAGAALLTAADPVGGALSGAVALITTYTVLALADDSVNIPDGFNNPLLFVASRVLDLVLKVGISVSVGVYAGPALAGLAGYAIAVSTTVVTYEIALHIMVAAALAFHDHGGWG